MYDVLQGAALRVPRTRVQIMKRKTKAAQPKKPIAVPPREPGNSTERFWISFRPYAGEFVFHPVVDKLRKEAEARVTLSNK